jgi:DNA-directed RNA polymerase specialized sigma24 family protein
MTDSDYQLIKTEAKAVSRRQKWSREDEEDFVQDVCIKILEAQPEYVNKGYLRTLFNRMLTDRNRKDIRRPPVVYSSTLADYMLEKNGTDNEPE